MNYLKLVLSGVVLYVVLLTINIPASFLISQFESQLKLQPKLALGQVSGTLWNGQLSSISYQGLTISPVNWQFSFASLFSAQLAFDLNVGNRNSAITGQGRVAYTLSGIAAQDVNLHAAVADITQVVPLPYGLTAKGNASLKVTEYLQGQPWCQQLEAKLDLKNANISSSFGGVDVNVAQAKLSCNKGDLVAITQPKTNSLGIKAKVVLNQQQQIVLSGFVKPPAQAPKDFVTLLNFTGKPDNQGRFKLDYQAKL